MTSSNGHLKPLRLFDLARYGQNQATDLEKAHLLACEECQPILEVFARQFSKPTKEKPKDAA
jgi:hypothetical protein